MPSVEAPRYPASVSIVIPAYNEVETINSVLDNVLSRIRSIPEIAWEIIVVDDGSTDRTAEVVAGKKDVKLVRHPLNRGYGMSLKTGITHAEGEYVLTMDSDGQHIDSEIPKLLNGAEEFDLTVGSRSATTSPAVRLPGKILLAILMQVLLWERIPDINSGMRTMRRKTIMKYFNVISNRFSFTMSSTIALMSEGHFIRFVPIESKPRDRAGRSQVGLFSGFSAILTIIRVILIFHPLRLFLPLSLIFGCMWFISLVYDLMNDNISDLSQMLLLLSLTSAFFGFLSEQLAHIRRELR